MNALSVERPLWVYLLVIGLVTAVPFADIALMFPLCVAMLLADDDGMGGTV